MVLRDRWKTLCSTATHPPFCSIFLIACIPIPQIQTRRSSIFNQIRVERWAVFWVANGKSVKVPGNETAGWHADTEFDSDSFDVLRSFERFCFSFRECVIGSIEIYDGINLSMLLWQALVHLLEHRL